MENSVISTAKPELAALNVVLKWAKAQEDIARDDWGKACAFMHRISIDPAMDGVRSKLAPREPQPAVFCAGDCIFCVVSADMKRSVERTEEALDAEMDALSRCLQAALLVKNLEKSLDVPAPAPPKLQRFPFLAWNPPAQRRQQARSIGECHSIPEDSVAECSPWEEFPGMEQYIGACNKVRKTT